MLMIVSCNTSTPRPEEAADSGKGEISRIGTTDAFTERGNVEKPDGGFSEMNALELFAYPRVPVLDIRMAPDTWKNLKKNARDEEYVPANVLFEGRLIGNVGVRFKGAAGSLQSCFNEKGDNICRKLSMKMKFNEYDRALRFFGLKLLNFHAYRWDTSFMRERLSYDLFRTMGIIAPRASWAMLRVNGEVIGLFGMVEQVDGRFTQDRWPDNPDGNLYKEAWPGNSDRSWIVSHLVTNEQTSDVDAFIAFSRAIALAKESELRSTLGRFVDLGYMARFLAVEDAIAGYDGITAWYTAADAAWAGNHNFYFYEESPARFTIIPWDQETTLTLNSGFGNVPRWTDTPPDCGVSYSVWNGENLVIAPGCDRMFRALAADLTEYKAACRALLDGLFRTEIMAKAIDAHAAFIRDAVKADPNGPGLTGFDGAVSGLKKEIPRLRNRLEGFLSGKSWTPVEIRVGGITTFENEDSFGLTMSALILSNPGSDISIEINTEKPLSGKKDLHEAFSFSNEEKPWEQWAFFRIPLAGGVRDLGSCTGIRMKARADKKRTLRIDIDSPKSTAASQGVRYGWDVELSADSCEVKLHFKDASIVPWAKSRGIDPGDNLKLILSTATALVFMPQCMGRNIFGQLPDGVTDIGFIRIDDIELF